MFIKIKAVGFLPDDFFEHEFVEPMSSKGFNFCLFYIRESWGRWAAGGGLIYGNMVCPTRLRSSWQEF